MSFIINRVGKYCFSSKTHYSRINNWIPLYGNIVLYIFQSLQNIKQIDTFPQESTLYNSFINCVRKQMYNNVYSYRMYLAIELQCTLWLTYNSRDLGGDIPYLKLIKYRTTDNLQNKENEPDRLNCRSMDDMRK